MECNLVNTSTTTLDELNRKEAISRLAVMIYIGTLALFGIIGNAHVLYVFRYRYKETTNYKIFVTMLSILDLLGCVIAMPFEIVDMALPYKFYVPVACRFFRFHDTTIIITSIFVLVMIAAERYQKTCRPLKRQFTIWHVRGLCFGAIFLGMVFAWPTAVFNGHRTVHLPNNLTGSDCSTNDDYIGSQFYTIYAIVVFVMFLSCTTLLIVLYISICRGIKRHHEKRIQMCGGDKYKDHRGNLNSELVRHSQTLNLRKMSSVVAGVSQKEQNVFIVKFQSASDLSKTTTKNISYLQNRRVTITLFLVSLLFVVSYLPYLVLQATVVLYHGKFDESLSEAGSVVYRIAMRLFYVNSVIDPFVYGFCDPQFRQELKTLYGFTYQSSRNSDVPIRQSDSSTEKD